MLAQQQKDLMNENRIILMIQKALYTNIAMINK